MKRAKTVTYNHKSTGSSNNGEEEEEEDRISELPDSLLHLILSFLDMTYVVQTSFLSRRWRYLWTSLPFLNFSDSYIQFHNNSKTRNSLRLMQNQRNQLSGFDLFIFVDRVLFLRNQNFNIERLRVANWFPRPQFQCIGRQCLSIAQIESWMHTLVRKNIKELDLNLNFLGNYFPTIFKYISHCKSLTTLKLDLSSLHTQRTNFHLPHDDDDDDSMKINLPSLKTLHLNPVEFLTGKTYNNFFSRSCPVLETLVISTSITGEITISAHQLKNLVIFDTTGMVYGSKYPMLSVFAPKLVTFCFKGSRFKDCSLNNNSSLLKAEITTSFPGSYHNVGAMINQKLRKVRVDGEWKVKHTENVIKCLRQISNVRCLMLSTWLLEGVYEIYKTGFRSILTPFCNLSILKLTTTLSMSHNRSIAYLLEECPNVENIVFELPKGFANRLREEEEEAEEIDLLPHCNLHYLKFVQIQNSIGRSNELAFLKFLLKNVMILEKVIVCTCMEISNHERIKTFREKLVNVVAASNSCTKIYFKYSI